MSRPAATPETADAPAPDPFADEARWELAAAREVGEIGLTFARALGRIAQTAIDQAGGETPEMTPQLADASLAFSRVSRAVRMAVGLHAKILRQRQARADRKAAEKAVQDAEAAAELEDRRDTGRLRRAMSRFIAGTAVEAEEREAPEAERLFAELDARLYGDGQDDADYDQIDVKGLAYEICQDLGIDPGPDWWEEAWGINARDPSPGRGRIPVRSGCSGRRRFRFRPTAPAASS